MDKLVAYRQIICDVLSQYLDIDYANVVSVFIYSRSRFWLSETFTQRLSIFELWASANNS
jgi:hypothetical protein